MDNEYVTNNGDYGNYGNYGDYGNYGNDEENKNKINLLKNIKCYQDNCRTSPFHCVSRDPYSTLSPDDLASHSDNLEVKKRKLRWQEIKLLPCTPQSVRRCKTPKFITPSWIAEHFGFVGRRSPVPLKYLHKQLGPVYTVVNTIMADAPAAWFDKDGNFIHSSYVEGWDHPSAKQVSEKKK